MKTFFTLIVMGIILSILPDEALAQVQAPGLGAAACYAILSGNGAVTNTGSTYVTGDVGTNLTTTTGYDPLKVIGTIHPIPDGSTNQATIDMIAAFNYLNALPHNETIADPDAFGNGMVLTAKTYLSGAATTLTGNLFLNAEGNSNAVFVIQINGALTTATAAKVILMNGALSNNVFWRVAGAVSLNTNAVFHGTIISNNGAINLGTGDSLYGRAFTTNGAIGATQATVISPEVTCIPFNTNCTEYRSVESGLWTDAINWEENSSGNWLVATTPPPAGSFVRVRHNIVQDTNFTVFNCALSLENNGISKLTIDSNMTLDFGGGIDGNAYFNGRPVVVKSTVNGTGAIGSMLTLSKTFADNNVTVERFIPGSKRRWNLLTFGVLSNTATIRDAWAGGGRSRVDSSQNAHDGVPLGTPPAPWNPKPDNFPYDEATDGLPADYVAGDGTIITGHRHSVAASANAQGYDWWPELIIPAGATWWETPAKSIISSSLRTTPSSIRPYIPGAISDFDSTRGTDWVSNAQINTGFGGNGLINMSLTNAFNTHQAFMLFTRGDRQVLENWYNETTLRPTGQLMKLNLSVPVAAKPVQNLTVVGNPYPAPIDFDTVYNANVAVIEPFFYIWDSRLVGNSGHGAWRTVFRVGPGQWHSTISADDSLMVAPDITTGNPQVISSSQGVMVEGTEAGGTLNFTEGMKANISDAGIVPFEVGEAGNAGLLFANLNTRSASNGLLNTVDGVAIVLDNAFTKSLSDKTDIRKVNSFTGELALSLKHNDQILMVEAYPNPTDEAIFPLETKGLTARGYAFTFKVKNLYADGREVFLKDKFLNTLTPINSLGSSSYHFDGTADKGSVSAARFEIIFKQATVLPVTFTNITAREHLGNVKVNWTVATEENMSHYEVEHSTNGTEYSKAVKVNAKNLSPASYEWLHVQPGMGDHFYRVRAINSEGRSITTRIAKVNLGNMGKPGFKVFPTIINQSCNVTVQITAMEKGNYSLQVTDMGGRVISSQMVAHSGGSSSLILNLPSSLSKGNYNVRLTGKSGDFVESVLKY